MRGIGCNCRAIGCTLSLAIILLLAGAIYVLIARPPEVLNPLKVWLNDSLIPEANPVVSREAVMAELNQQVAQFQIGENNLTLREGQFKTLLAGAFSDILPESSVVSLEPDLVKIFWDTTGGDTIPLWLLMEFRVDNSQKLYLDKIGTQRVPIPTVLNGAFTAAFLSVWRIGKQEAASDLMNLVLPLPENITIKEITVFRDQMLLNLDVRTGLENVFQ
jgi:hypothetical protein